MSGRRDRGGLWWLAAAPTVWLLHFLACYIAVAVRCAKALDGAPLGDLRSVLWAITAGALAAIAAIGWRGWSRHRTGMQPLPHDDDSAAYRRRFLGFAGFLLCVLSAIAVLYTALAIAASGTCR